VMSNAYEDNGDRYIVIEVSGEASAEQFEEIAEQVTTCEARSCVRPDHLTAVTHRENLLASNTLAGINARKTHCKRGHEFDKANTYICKEGKRMCRQCKRDRRAVIRDGDIGEPKRWIEFELLPESVPIEEPTAP